MLRSATLCLIFASTLLADDLPRGVVNTQNPDDVSLTPQESLARITVPDGFHVTLFAGEPDVRRPIAFDFDDRGRLWVVENYSHPKWKADNATDRIIILEDTDHDGQFDKRKIFWDKGRYLTGIAFGHGGVWIANTPELSFIPDRDRDDKPDSEPVVVLDGFQISINNVLNNFHWGPDGWLYGAIGLSDPSLVGKPGTPDEQRVKIARGIWRFHPLRHNFEVVAQGMVNPWGADFNEYGDLFTANTVTAHLWHIVPGMYCQGRAKEDNPYVYRRIQSIANHLHWGGGQWTSSRSGEQHSVAGGGHAHCGGMVYLGDNWPDEYRGKFFTSNLHGNRINCDELVPNRSTYVGVHDKDVLFTNDPWFRGMSLKYGPDGGVYVSDWHDFGECHDSDGGHRTSGRIYKIVCGEPEKRALDLNTLSNAELVDLHLHPNEWFVRHARRILHERAAGQDMQDVRDRLEELSEDKDEMVHLRVAWTMFVVSDQKAFKSVLTLLMHHDSEHVRRMAIRLLVDDGDPNREGLETMFRLAQHATPKIRLAIALALQRIQPKHRMPIAARLMAHAEDVEDPYIPLMIWYAIEPLVESDETAALELAVNAQIPLLRRFIARRAIDQESPALDEVVLAAKTSEDQRVRLDLLQGIHDALETRGATKPPPSWGELYSHAASSSLAELRSVAVRLATIFGDKDAIAELREMIRDREAEPAKRLASLQALLKVKGGVPVPMLHELAAAPSGLRRDAIQALIVRSDDATSDVLLDSYEALNARERQDAISVLATRNDFANKLLDAIEDSSIDHKDVSAFTLQQLQAFNDATIKKRVEALWPRDSRVGKKSDEIARYKRTMNSDYLAAGDASAGRGVFAKTCAKCHTLFGEGGNVGPDLTGSGRQKLDYVLSNLIDPSAIIDPKYRLTNIFTADGRILSGFIVHQDDSDLVLRTQEAEVRLAMKDIDEFNTSNKSMMPEGMLRAFTNDQIRDLVVYLASPQQIPLAE
ncbi:MAG: c-type cytochrome [Planctomycetes bacterium]|nr:c-type cytochrome [Planctomycetota bacterium]